eukprot:266347-Alexandrium_andersonii.AAC.1
MYDPWPPGRPAALLPRHPAAHSPNFLATKPTATVLTTGAARLPGLAADCPICPPSVRRHWHDTR